MTAFLRLRQSLAILLVMLLTTPLLAADHALVLMYHRFGEDDVPLTNIRLAQFEAHLDHLEQGGFAVLPLSQVLDTLASGEPLPDRTVVLTADDAYLSVMTEAWPRVKSRGWTMTLFVATDPVDRGLRRYLDWDQIRRLRDEGMEIGAHSATHGHLTFMDTATARADILRGQQRLAAELGQASDVFAYPFGEYGEDLRKMVAEMGFRAAFGQHSGAIGRARDRHDLPRFAMNERYGEIERFRTAIRARPLPVTDSLPRDTRVAAGSQPTYEFRVGGDLSPDRLNCYHSTAPGAVALDVAGSLVRFTAPGPLPKGRSRFNCTMPAGDGGWFWYGRQFVAPAGKD
ncbi:MAG: polysaccharide deacetylase family protein [Minwuia sp.]|nr:polysaccharide deacetylase family protein [Minwuia sp.]